MTSVMVLDGLTSFLRLKDVKNACKCSRNSPTFGGVSSVQAEDFKSVFILYCEF